MKILFIFMVCFFLINCNKSKKTGGSNQPPAPAFSCPDNYVRVPALAGYTTNDFCVMKYEAKNDGSGNAVSEASGTPYVNINQVDSITKCTNLGEGYDLITNDEWQSLARNIELVGSNWDTGVVGSEGGLSTGHSDNSPENALAASSNDNAACFETEQTCNSSTWDSQRRTHTLSNGEVIWDASGNVREWVKDTHDSVDYGATNLMSSVTNETYTTLGTLIGGTTTTARTAKDQFGPSGDYSELSAGGGLGIGSFSVIDDSNGVNRSSSWEFGGVFTVSMRYIVTYINSLTGFRCAYHP